MTLLRARVVVPMTSPPIADGGVLVENGRVKRVGRYSDLAGETDDHHALRDQILLPGFINAHCHLDYTHLRGVIPPPESFTAWVGEINALKRQTTEEELLQSIAEGYAELRRWGTTTVCNLEAYPEIYRKLPPEPVRTWWFPEMIDLREPERPFEQEAISTFAQARHYGLCPHAPYTASPGLYRRTQAAAEARGLLCSTHLAESADEEAMFARGEGSFHALLQNVGRPMGDCGLQSSFLNAVKNGLVKPGWLLAHMNELEEADFAWLAVNPGPWEVVHCPKSHTYFQHRPFPWKRLKELGVNISLGTDSLASNDTLSLFAEMQEARKSNPWLTSEDLVETITLNPAKALGMQGQLGEIAEGAWADMIALPFAGSIENAFDAIITNSHPVTWMMQEGQC